MNGFLCIKSDAVIHMRLQAQLIYNKSLSLVSQVKI